MSDSTTRIFMPENGGFGGNGLEGALIGSMMNGGCGGGAFNNPIWALVFLAFLGNNFGFGGSRGGIEAVQTQLNTIQGQNALMSAITGGTGEVRSLANVLNADVNAVQSAINGVQSAICNVGNSVGMNSMQVVNAIQAGNTAIANQISQCCCDNKLLTTTQGYESRISNLQQSQMIQNGFTNAGYQSADNTSKIIAKLDAIEDSRKDREIGALTAENATLRARAERAAELAPIYKAIEKIPNTVPVQWPQLVGVPASQLYGYGVFNNGQWS